MSTLVRIAPSPTGYLHVGNVRTALVNWLFARKTGGKFMLRFDDTDQERSKKEYEDAAREDLRWLGLQWDVESKQSDRFAQYDAAKQKLAASGRLYACYETSEELDVQRKMQASRGQPPIYNRAALKLTDAEKQKYESEGRRPHWRFLLKDADIAWNDLIRGESKFNATHMSDPVLIRADGVPLYTLASVVDDGEMHVTHVIRGEDHVTNTAVQIQIFEAMGFALPKFAHLALLKTKEGEMSKRLGGNDIRALREAGMLPMAVNSLLAKIGTSDPVEPIVSLDALVKSFDFGKFGRAPANYDVAELEALNAKLLHHLPYSAVKSRLPAQIDEAFWNSVRGNIKNVSEVEHWWKILHGDISAELNHDERTFLREAAPLLPTEPWDETTWGVWTKALGAATGRKGKDLFMPLRRALTGMDHGPEMKALLPLIGRKKVVERLQ